MPKFLKESFIPILGALFLLMGIIFYLQKVAVELSRKPTIIKISNQYFAEETDGFRASDFSLSEFQTEFEKALEKNMNFV